MTTLRTPQGLAAAGLVAAEAVPALERVAARYGVAVSDDLAALMHPDDPDDPIARQFLPDPRELDTTPQERADPIGDDAHSPVEGIVHRYPDRVLLKAVHVCPVYCRFCFRREMVGPEGLGTLSAEALERALDYIRAHGEIWEVILTGGDPLILSPRRLRAILDALAAIPHVKIIRLHTRVPVVEPDSVTDELAAVLRVEGKTTYVAVHANHARELSEKARTACARLVDAGIPLLGQSVLLRGINDSAEVLGELMRAMVETRIKPYYLHHPDLAPGTAHFRLSITEGQAIVGALRGHFSGLCQPAYVLDIPGGHGKSPIGPSYVSAYVSAAEEPDSFRVRDYQGGEHIYPPPCPARD